VPSTGECVDAFSNPCTGCLATNQVCYDEPKAWCDQWSSYTWCGGLSPLRRLRGVPLK
jgi:hypothetical protein